MKKKIIIQSEIKKKKLDFKENRWMSQNIKAKKC